MKHVFENEKIRVTVSDAAVESFREDAELAARRSSKTFEQALRGLIIGAAMRKLAYGIVARRLAENPPEPDPDITLNFARIRLISRWYDEHGNPGTKPPLELMLIGGRMPSFYRAEYDKAKLWASDQLANCTDAAREAIYDSEAEQHEFWASEQRYCEAVARHGGWDIEIKSPDALPRPVGLVEV